MKVSAISALPGLTREEKKDVNDLIVLLGRKSVRNRLRTRYYDSRQTIQHLGIAVPPQLQSVETVIGWPAKSVDALEQRIDLDGFVLANGNLDDFGLDQIWDNNRLSLESSEAHISALKYAVTFVAVLAGEKTIGEPDVVIRPLSATGTTAKWDPIARRVKTALSVTQVTDSGEVKEFILYNDKFVHTLTFDGAKWVNDSRAHVLGRAPIAVLPFRPSLEYPFGRSRISRAVMSITDRAVRTLLRMEVSAEFYSSPQRYVLGANEKDFVGADGKPRTGWEVMLGKVLALEGDPNSDKLPVVGQFAQMTMQPHVEMVRADAALFAGETGLPVSSLGIIHDNPASDAAMQTAYLDLVKTAERAAIPFGMGWVDAMKLAVMVRDGLSEPPSELAGLKAKFRNPATSTRTEAANATVQFVSAFPWASDSDVALEMFGLDRTDISRLQTIREQGKISTLLSTLQTTVSDTATEIVATRDDVTEGQ